MSVVAVKRIKDKIIIGSDSIRVSGWTQEKDKQAKLVKINGLIIGTVGNSEEFAMFTSFVKTHKPKKADEDSLLDFFVEFRSWLANSTGKNDKTIENEYLIVLDNRVFYIASFFVREVKDYYAMGAGRDFALSALYLGSGIKEAINAACELSIYCEKPINIFRTT